MRDADVIRETQSEFASPLLIIPKPDGRWRGCVDYRKLNELTEKDSYPLPRMDECLDSLGSASGLQLLMPILAIGKCQYIRLIYIRLRSPVIMARRSSQACHSGCVTHPRHSEELWIYCCHSISEKIVSSIWKILSSIVQILTSTSTMCRSSLENLRKPASV